MPQRWLRYQRMRLCVSMLHVLCYSRKVLITSGSNPAAKVPQATAILPARVNPRYHAMCCRLLRCCRYYLAHGFASYAKEVNYFEPVCNPWTLHIHVDMWLCVDDAYLDSLLVRSGGVNIVRDCDTRFVRCQCGYVCGFHS